MEDATQGASDRPASRILPRLFSETARSFSHDSIVVVLVTTDQRWKREKTPTAIKTGTQAV